MPGYVGVGSNPTRWRGSAGEGWMRFGRPPGKNPWSTDPPVPEFTIAMSATPTSRSSKLRRLRMTRLNNIKAIIDVSRRQANAITIDPKTLWAIDGPLLCSALSSNLLTNQPSIRSTLTASSKHRA